jgi:Glycosyltransferase family 87
VELLHRPIAPLIAVLAAVALALPAGAAARPPLEQPPSQTKPPELFRLSANQVERIADRAEKVRDERRAHPDLEPTAYTRGPRRWQVSYFSDGVEEAQVLVDDGSGAILEQWSGPQVAWTMARGYEGAFGRKLNAPYVWLPLCLLFLLPFVDPRRPFRLLHLDLLVMLGFGVSHVFFNRGEISTSVPLVYPVLVYLLARMLIAGFRGRERGGPLVPIVPAAWLAVGLVFLVAFRAGLNVVDSNVIDVGYSGVIGADRIVDGSELYGERYASDNEHGDTYGPVNYLFYVPFEQALAWSGTWDDLPAAHGAALAADLLVIVGLILLGRRLRPGSEGRTLGLALGFAWAAYPYSTFALESNSNDTLVAVAVVGAMLALTLAPVRRAAVAGLALGLGAAAKFAPLALAPLVAAGRWRPLSRESLVFAVALVAALAVTVLPFLPDGGLREFYDQTVGYQAGRPSPFSLWGQEPSLDWLQTAVKVAAVALALLVAAVARGRTPAQLAALGAAVLIALQLAMTHWFYLYVVWFAPLVLVALFVPLRPAADRPQPAERPPALAAA